jgi:hypothetical protein
VSIGALFGEDFCDAAKEFLATYTVTIPLLIIKSSKLLPYGRSVDVMKLKESPHFFPEDVDVFSPKSPPIGAAAPI